MVGFAGLVTYVYENTGFVNDIHIRSKYYSTSNCDSDYMLYYINI